MAATWLADALRAGGCRVDESLVPNWKSRGHAGSFTPLGVLLHHTAGPATGNLPSLRVVRDGRSDLPGPLAQLMLARDGTFVPIAAGVAWHAGAGYAKWVPNQDGNRYLVGIEAESVGTRDDWTDAQREAYPRGVAALCAYMRVGADRVLGHREWAPTRKIDPAYIDLNGFRDRVARILSGGSPNFSKAAKQMRYANLDNPTGETPDRTCVLTIDSLGDSIVMPNGARAWLQWEACFPFGGEKSIARVDWLVFNYGAGKASRAFNPFNLAHRGYGALELDKSVESVEIVVRGIPKGGAVGVHLDGIGHG